MACGGCYWTSAESRCICWYLANGRPSESSGYSDFLVLDQKLTLSVQPAVPIASGYDSYWPFRRDERQVIDITLGVVLSEPSDFEILGYVALPRWMTGANTFRFTGSSSRTELFGCTKPRASTLEPGEMPWWPLASILNTLL
jgi:hypothetical protein